MLDIINFIYVVMITLLLSQYFKLSKIVVSFLFLHLFGIFIFNGFLFDPSYMPDQFRYLASTQLYRSFDFASFDFSTVSYASFFFAFFPLPFIESIHSISLINFMLYFFLYLFMHKKRLINSKFILWFYLMYPSLFLYSSVALRDQLVFCVMFISIYYLFSLNNKQISFLFIFTLLFIKIQNFFIFILSYFINIIISKKIKFINLIWGSTAFFATYYYFSEFFTLEAINFYRAAFYYENLGSKVVSYDTLILFNNYNDLFNELFLSIFNLFFRPLPWKEFGSFQIAQFFENCIILIFILFIIYKNFYYKLWKHDEIKFINLLLLFSLIIYGLVIFNSGTAVRYKFPFIAIYIIYSIYFINNFRKVK